MNIILLCLRIKWFKIASRYRNTFVEFLLMPMVDSTTRKEGRLCTETYLYDAYITASLYNSTFERISLSFNVGFSTNSLLYKARITYTKSSLPLVKSISLSWSYTLFPNCPIFWRSGIQSSKCTGCLNDLWSVAI